VTSCQFNATLGGIGDFIVASAPAGHFTPENGNVVNAKVYTYYAQSYDALVPTVVTAWEAGSGAYDTATHKLKRTTITANSNDDLLPVNFPLAPVVDVYPSSSNTLEPLPRTRTVFTSGSGTYTTPVNCRFINVRLIGGGGGGSGGDVGGTGGGVGGNTTFGISLLAANGGGNGGSFGFANAVGGSSSGGDINQLGSPGQAWGPGGASPVVQGGIGGAGPFGGAGYGGWPGAAGAGAFANSGAGGGGGGPSAAGHGGNSGASGGYCEKLIVTPLATYSYAIGAGGTAGGAGGSGAFAGGAGGSGLIIVDEYY
jgi:hypothetical protein